VEAKGIFVGKDMTLEAHAGGANVKAGTIFVKKNMTLLSGDGNKGGSNGSVTLRADNLVIGNANMKDTANITLIKRNGALNFDVKNLIVNENCYAKISLDGTEAWSKSSGVYFQNLILCSGSTFGGIFTVNNARYTPFDSYTILGKGVRFEGDFLGNGKKLRFLVPADVGDDTMLTVTGNAILNGGDIDIAFDKEAPDLSVGDRIVLVKANTIEIPNYQSLQGAHPVYLFLNGDKSLSKAAEDTHKNGDRSSNKNGDKQRTQTITSTQGVSVEYTFLKFMDGGNLQVRVVDMRLIPSTKAFSEATIAAIGAVNCAIDLAANAGIQNFTEQGRIFTVFSGGTSRYQSGSHVDVNEFAALIGYGKKFEMSVGKFTAAAFCEGVFGSYKTHNTFAGIGDVTGSGDTKGFGGGIFCRLDFNGSEKGHFYGEGTAHIGKINYSFGSSDMVDAAGRKASYSSEDPYYGLHGSLGYIGKISDNAHWDLYGKCLLMHKEGKISTLSTGEKIVFKDASSQRVIAGLKLARFVSDTTKIYVGGAHSYEFAGKINAQIQGLDVETPSLRGSTEILEVGIANKWSDNFVDFAIQGYAGKRSGISAAIYLEHSF
jgi:hypothetical protein